MILTSKFFNRDASTVAKDLLGKVVTHRYTGFDLKAQIIETEAYYITEKGSHASLGFTEKRKALFMKPGTIYMYYARGKDSFNISARGKGNAVLIKSAIPYLPNENKEMVRVMKKLNPKKDGYRETMKLCSGQTLLCASLGLKVSTWNQKSLVPDKLYISDCNYVPKKIITTKRIGIPKGRDEHLMLRFVDYMYSRYSTQNVLAKRNCHENKDYIIECL